MYLVQYTPYIEQAYMHTDTYASYYRSTCAWVMHACSSEGFALLCIHFDQHVTSLHFDDIALDQLVVCMSRSTCPAFIMHWVGTVDFVMLVKCVAHFEAHWSQFSSNLLHLLCLWVAQVPRYPGNFCVHDDNDDMTNYFIPCTCTWDIVQLQ